MADPTTTAEPTDQTGPLDAGHTTTEYAIAKWISILSAVVAGLGTVSSLLEKVTDLLPSGGAVGLWLALGGVAVAAITQFAYGLQRTLVKIAAIKAGHAPLPPAAPVKNPDDAAANLGR